MIESISHYILQLLYEIAAVDTELILLAVLLVMAVIVLDSVSLVAQKKRNAAGITKQSVTVSIDGSKSLPVRHYVSEMQGLAGRPDALISEKGYLIPIERKPLAKKIHDRYIAQLLVYMRLIEEFEGKRPPYGYLILGPNCRRFKIDNTPERQAWLQKMLDEMHAILKGGPAQPSPHPRKCRKCDVRESCAHACVDERQTGIKSRSAALSKTAS